MKLYRTNIALILSALLLLPTAGRAQADGDDGFRPALALRSNLLYDAALVPNVGVEVPLGKGWTVGADYVGTWLYSDGRHRYWQCIGGYAGVRRYLGKSAATRRMTGHHLGLYGLVLTYDVEFGGRGYQASTPGFGGGVEYGWSAAIGRRLCLDLSVGVGYQGGEYKEYDPKDDRYLWRATKQRHWWGPTKAEVSLKWLLGRMKKGGSR